MDYGEILLEESAQLTELLNDANPSTPIPTCPSWDLTALVSHLYRTCHMIIYVVDQHSVTPPSFAAIPQPSPSSDFTQALEELSQTVHQLVTAVNNHGLDNPIWTLAGPQPAQWWLRRVAYEVLVHRADAALALGKPFHETAERSADVISEWLDLVKMFQAYHLTALEEGQSIHLHALDPDLGPNGEWTITCQDHALTWSHSHGKGSVALRGPATELMLVILGRIPVEKTQISLLGDEAVWNNWLKQTPFLGHPQKGHKPQ